MVLVVLHEEDVDGSTKNSVPSFHNAKPCVGLSRANFKMDSIVITPLFDLIGGPASMVIHLQNARRTKVSKPTSLHASDDVDGLLGGDHAGCHELGGGINHTQHRNWKALDLLALLIELRDVNPDGIRLQSLVEGVAVPHATWEVALEV